METRSASARKVARNSRALSMASCRPSADCASHCGGIPARIRKQIEAPNPYLETLNIVFTALLSACAKKATRDGFTQSHTNKETPVVFLRQARQEGLSALEFRSHGAR